MRIKDYGLRIAWVLIAWECGAAEVRLGWDEQPDAAGFKIYYGLASRTYFNCQDVGHTNRTTIKNLGSGKTYFFAATATNSAGESGFSNEISWNDEVAQVTNNMVISMILERGTNILGPWSGITTNRFTNSVSGTRFFRCRMEQKLITQ